VSDDLYQAAIVDLARAAHGAGSLDDPKTSATADNPLCGDRVAVDLRLASGRVEAFAHRVRGCLLCQASASALGAALPGATPAEIDAAEAAVTAMLQGQGDGPAGHFAALAQFRPVAAKRSRHVCVMLPFRALAQALKAG
jgi:nitrogen fixation NifU-like protein